MSNINMGGAANPVVADNFTADTGTAVPAANNINLLGTANQIHTAAAGSTVTYSLPNAVIAPGSLSSTTLFSTLAGQVVNRTATAISYAVLVTDYYIGVTNNGAARTITLPAAPTTNQVFVVKDEAGTAASANNITITVSGGAINIDGALTKLINVNFGSLNLIFNGTQYYTW